MSSLEAALDEEMKDVVAILEGKPKGLGPRADSPSLSQRAQSPGSAASPKRSMLDVDNGLKRSSSRGSTGIPFAMPSSPRRINPESAYKFDMLPSIDAHALPKRVSQGGYKDPRPRAMSSVYGNSSGFLSGGLGRDRHNSASGPLARSKSGSPGPHRSVSPLSLPASPAPTTNNTLVTDSGKRIDGDTAYRKLSDSALARSEGGLSALPNRKGSDLATGTTTAPGGGVRLTTDDDGDESAAVESSEGDSDSSIGGDGSTFAGPKKKERGRRRTRKESGGTDSMGREIITAKSLFATAEQEGGTRQIQYIQEPLLTFLRERYGSLVQSTVAVGPKHKHYRPQWREND
jgi:hypothetical protein